MIIIDAKTGCINDVNLAACNYYAYSKEELLSMNIEDINISTKEDISKEMDEVKTKSLKFLRFQHKLSNGKIRDVEVHSSHFKIADKDLLLSIIYDVKEKSKMEKEYVKNKAYFDNLFNNSPEAIAIVDRDFKILNANERFKEVFQYDLAEIEKQDITKLLCEETLYDTSYNFRSSITKGDFISEEVKRRKKDGSTLDVLLMGFPLLINHEITGAYCIYTDITETKKQQKEINKLTYNDRLTGLFSREFFFENLENEILKKADKKAKNEKLAVLILNVNEFKEIKDALGQLVGDLILKEFALKLRASVQDDNIIVARIINNEFALIIRNLKGFKNIKLLIDRIIESLKEPFLIDMNEL